MKATDSSIARTKCPLVWASVTPWKEALASGTYSGMTEPQK